jgi:hypothetical protein
MSEYHPIRVDLIPTSNGVARNGFIRIGDAERDQAVSLLGDHFVAGRLTQEEFEERSGLATRARYADDLTPLFDDLPNGQDDPRTWSPGSAPWSPAWSHGRSRGPRSGPPRFRQGPPPPFFFLAPLLMLGLVAAVVMTAPWLLWILFWVALFGGKWQHQHRYHHPRNHTRTG